MRRKHPPPCYDQPYPDEVCGCLREAVNVFLGDDTPDGNILGLVLTGSSARGELTIQVQPALEILGDFEFLVVLKERAWPRKTRVLEQLTALNTRLRHAYGPFAEVSFVSTTAARLHTAPRNFWMFETLTAGKVVYGDSALLSKPPKITVSNLDYLHLSDVILHRLWAMLHRVEWAKAIKGIQSPSERRRAYYVIARNGLDIMTVLLPYVGQLIPGYGGRLRWVTENRESLPERFQGEFVDVMAECFMAKMGALGGDPLALHAKVLALFEALVEMLRRQAGVVFPRPLLSARQDYYTILRLYRSLKRNGAMHSLRLQLLINRAKVLSMLLDAHRRLQETPDTYLTSGLERDVEAIGEGMKFLFLYEH